MFTIFFAVCERKHFATVALTNNLWHRITAGLNEAVWTSVE